MNMCGRGDKDIFTVARHLGFDMTGPEGRDAGQGMALFLIIFNVVAPVFLIAGSGYLWVKRGVEYPTEFVTRLATNIAIPCLVFDSLVNTNSNIKTPIQNNKQEYLTSLVDYFAVYSTYYNGFFILKNTGDLQSIRFSLSGKWKDCFNNYKFDNDGE